MARFWCNNSNLRIFWCGTLQQRKLVATHTRLFTVLHNYRARGGLCACCHCMLPYISTCHIPHTDMFMWKSYSLTDPTDIHCGKWETPWCLWTTDARGQHRIRAGSDQSIEIYGKKYWPHALVNNAPTERGNTSAGHVSKHEGKFPYKKGDGADSVMTHPGLVNIPWGVCMYVFSMCKLSEPLSLVCGCKRQVIAHKSTRART